MTEYVEDPAEVERIAREMAVERGFDPDGLCTNVKPQQFGPRPHFLPPAHDTYEPIWHAYKVLAQAMALENWHKAQETQS